MVKVTAVKRNSSAAHAGIKKGDSILSIGGYPAVDEFDFLYFDGEETEFCFDGKGTHTLPVSDLEVAADGRLRTCHNHCIFCFVDQMPKGMRPSLYIKDDDYTMSFECGNFVTLTNLSDEELERIIRLKLSPLYVSVHTTNPERRCALLRNRFAGKIKEQLKRLAEAGIAVHCQAVIVPHMNDGEDLMHTARELFSYYPNICDLAVVPTGLTKFREGLTEIPDIDGEYSKAFLDLVDRLNAEFKVNFVLPADEYFIRAGRALKDVEFYGDFAQIENGIGMSTKFIAEFDGALQAATRKKRTRVLSVCGVSAAGIVEELCKKANEKIGNLEAHALPVENEFFGKSVTCTGLLTGVDIVRALQSRAGTFDEVILPS
ncbi:MAG: DUF512 domain-containing protein, partial [Clostridiales bacterium]|nr:DUF512 domain-containing protein [Clostridiales bacterium]